MLENQDHVFEVTSRTESSWHYYGGSSSFLTDYLVPSADAKCCAKLAAIKFTSNLPVVIVDSGSNNITRTARPASLCTCSQGLVKGDVNATVDFRLRGGTNSRKRFAKPL